MVAVTVLAGRKCFTANITVMVVVTVGAVGNNIFTRVAEVIVIVV